MFDDDNIVSEESRAYLAREFFEHMRKTGLIGADGRIRPRQPDKKEEENGDHCEKHKV